MDQVIYASKGSIVGGEWRVVGDASAAGGARLENPDAGRAKVTTAVASPASYVEVSFDAEAGKPYRLWLRMQAQNNYWANDSVHVQISGSTNASGAAVYRIGTTASAEVNLEDCSGCGVSGWGWQDNGYGAGVLGPVIYFANTGTQTLRLQRRDDGVSIDQIVLSPVTYLNSAPGGLKNDTTILLEAGG